MKLITIFPSIRFENERIYPKIGKKDKSLLEFFSFKDSLILSSNIISELKRKIPKKIRDEIESVSDQIIDSCGSKISEYSIIYDKKVKTEQFKPINTDATQIFNYFAYVKNLDHHNSLDFIKIKFFDSGMVKISINNEDEGLTDKYLYMTLQPQGYYFPIYFNLDTDFVIVQTLEYLSKKEQALYKQILTSINLFNQACRISYFSQNSAIVLITSAFEALLQIPRSAKRDNFSYAFKLFWGFNQRIEDWAAQLYELRNQIVHGAFVEDKKLFVSSYEHYQHFNIGREIFHSSLLMLLDIKGVIRIDNEFRHEETRNLLNKIKSNKEKVDNILKAKKVYNYKSFTKNKKLYKEFIQKIEGLTSIDYSAGKNIYDVINIVCKILKDWTTKLIEDEKIKSSPNKYSASQIEKWQSIQLFVDEINSISWDDISKYKIEDLLNQIKEELRKLYPVVHKKNEYKFNLSEFGTRCIDGLWATY